MRFFDGATDPQTPAKPPMSTRPGSAAETTALTVSGAVLDRAERAARSTERDRAAHCFRARGGVKERRGTLREVLQRQRVASGQRIDPKHVLASVQEKWPQRACTVAMHRLTVRSRTGARLSSGLQACIGLPGLCSPLSPLLLGHFGIFGRQCAVL